MQKEMMYMEEFKPEREFRLTLEVVKELWSKTYNTNGKPDWSHILPYYDDTIYFKDTIQEIRGIAAFKEMTDRTIKRFGYETSQNCAAGE